MTDLAPDPNGAHLQQLCEQMHRESLSKRGIQRGPGNALDPRSESDWLSGAEVQPERVPSERDGNEQVLRSDSGPSAALSRCRALCKEFPQCACEGRLYS